MHRSEKCKHGWSLYSPTKCFKCQDELVGRPPWGYVETTSFITGDSGDETDYRPIDKLFGKPLKEFKDTFSAETVLMDSFFPSSKTTNPKDALGIKKVPFSTISWPVLAELGVAMLEGALKYGRHNYRTIGVRASVYVDAANRHLASYWEGEDIDPDSGLSHITKAIASLVVLRDAMINDKFTDDRPPRPPAEWMGKLNEAVGALLVKYPDPVKPYTHTDNTWIET